LRTLVATDGLEAVAMTKQEHPHLILMDLNMPYVSGFEAIRRIKDDPLIKDIPSSLFPITTGIFTGSRRPLPWAAWAAPTS
jgi:CheY-like chemotaxis protein